MKNKEEEYKEIFLAEALDNFEEINRLLTVLEKNTNDKDTVHALFRITHTLKGNASGMGFTGIAEMSHVLEDLFGEVRDGRIQLDSALFTSLFKGLDALGSLINAVRDGGDPKYKGIKTKLEVLLKRALENKGHAVEEPVFEEAAVATAQTNGAALVMPENGSTGDEEDESEEADEDTKVSFSDLVQVPVRKLDNLLNLVGELIIEKDRMQASRSGLHASNEYARLSRISSDLQYSVMDVRLVQVGFLFNKFHRVVRDAASVEGKNVVLKLEGTDTEIDRNVLQVISDSLIHIIRNAVGHGIETPEERTKAGKPNEGVVWLNARNDTDAVIIEIKDDGKGLDRKRIRQKAISKGLITEEEAAVMTEDDLSMLIFEPGFSTVDQVTAISGRGVGMDVVKKTLESIGGTIRVLSQQGEGTMIELTLPSSMAVKSCLLFELSREVYAIPLAYTESVVSLYKSDIHKVGGGLVASLQDKNVAITFLKDIFETDFENEEDQSNVLQHTFDTVHPETKLEIVIVSFNHRTVGLVVDKLLQQKEIVEKPLTRPVDRIRFISGVTILGSGNVCLVLNIPFILQFVFNLTLGRVNRKMTIN